MKPRRAASLLLGVVSLAAGSALAHDGHGQAGAHWHATDSWGWIALAVLAAAVWLARRK